MKRYFGIITAAVVALLLPGCIGSGGSSAPAPLNVHVVAKDSRVIVTFDMLSGVEYWIFHANGSGVTPQNCSSMPLCYTTVNVGSPGSVLSLYNDYLYSFSINGRRSGGPGGTGSAAVETTPRLAGATWTPYTSPTTSNLIGITYGAYDSNANRFVAVGAAGALYSGTVYTKIDTATGLATTGITWAALVNPLTTPAATNFNAVNYDSYRGKYLSVGTGGKIIAMTPSSSTTWTELTYYTGGQNLFAIANNSGGITVVTGATGTILTSSDGGSTWAYPNSNTTNALNGVAYGYVTASAVYRFVAVGASGTVRYSTDGVTWATDASVPITSEIKGVTYGLVASVGTFVAVTADGKVITSPDGKTWTLTTASAISTSALNAVTASANVITPAPLLTTATNTNVFVTVDNAGNIFRSVNGGVTWSSVNTGSGSPLYAIIRGGLYDYATVGSAGLNLYAD